MNVPQGWIRAIALLVALAGSGGCLPSKPVPGGAGAPGDRVTLAVEVSAFSTAAIHDDFADGTHAAYDLAVLAVLGPERYRGTQLRVIRPAGSPPGNAWVSQGQHCQVSIAPWAMYLDAHVPLDTVTLHCVAGRE